MFVVKIMIKILTNRKVPLAIEKIELTIRIIYSNIIIKELLHVSYIRKTRGIIRIILKTTVAYELEKY